MADIGSFKHNGKTVEVFTGQKSSDVYYQVAGGSKRSINLRWDSSKGWFKTGSGDILTYEEGMARIRTDI